jgi:flagellar basal-body rod protein FlgB
MFTDSISSAALEKALAANWQKAQLIANNIANEDTPGYKARRMEFESYLRKELQHSNMRVTAMNKRQRISRISSLRPLVYQDKSTEGRVDGNNVNIDSEQMELARVQIQYQALRDKINGHYQTLKYAISGGR